KSPVSPQVEQIASAHSSLVTVVANNETTKNGLHARFTCCLTYSSTTTDAVFQLDPESNLIPEEVGISISLLLNPFKRMTFQIDFAYLVWESFPDRLIGFSARDHYFDSSSDQWTYT